MKTLTTEPRRKPGPHPKGYKRQHIFLPSHLADWAKDQEGGLSGLVRRLLAEERQRESSTSATP
jgi:hypothetical protein